MQLEAAEAAVKTERQAAATMWAQVPPACTLKHSLSCRYGQTSAACCSLACKPAKHVPCLHGMCTSAGSSEGWPALDHRSNLSRQPPPAISRGSKIWSGPMQTWSATGDGWTRRRKPCWRAGALLSSCRYAGSQEHQSAVSLSDSVGRQRRPAQLPDLSHRLSDRRGMVGCRAQWRHDAS